MAEGPIYFDAHLLSKALRIIGVAFGGKFDRGGAPYTLHCLVVMEAVRSHGYSAMTVAVLHDLLEDCPEWTPDRLFEEGFSKETIGQIIMLTRRKDEDYLVYIGRVALDPITRAIKIEDLRHNMRPDRLIDLSEKTMERMKKYHTAFKMLTGGV